MSKAKKLSDWLQWLESNHPVDKIELGLARVRTVAERLGLTQTNLPVITVAGTNGKGSVIAALESLAKQHKLEIGSYTSPHLLRFNERIKISGTPVADDDLVIAFEQIAKAQAEIALTYFEFTTLVGLYIFKQADLDFIALEVGLGGRLDAVNIVDAEVAVITSIGLDHTDWLGDDLVTIANEKAGIMRPNKAAVLADKTIKSLAEKTIEEIKPQLICHTDDYQTSELADCWDYQYGDFKFKQLAHNALHLPNLAAALTAFIKLFPEKVTQEMVAQAMASTQLAGRSQHLNANIILDVAHNADSAKLLNQKAQSLKSSNSRIWALCGMLKDKDIAGSLSHMQLVDRWLLLDLPEPRGALASELAVVLNQLMDKQELVVTPITQFAEIARAFDYFSKNATEHDYLLVFGSFVTVAQMLEYWQRSELV